MSEQDMGESQNERQKHNQRSVDAELFEEEWGEDWRKAAKASNRPVHYPADSEWVVV